MESLKAGPLAPVWMAANYEKKLTKQQFLSTNIVTSTGLLNTPINTSSENITLRLSGQLLLGIVRIYSRKTKYLLDDVNDILYKLKNSFKFASGGVLLGSESNGMNSNSTSIGNTGGTKQNQKNILHNVNNIILQDQVTGPDLLYQEDLDLDVNVGTDQSIGEQGASLFTQSRNNLQVRNASHDFDQSIELGRFDHFDHFDHFDDTGDNGADIDFDLDFDNNNDDDINNNNNNNNDNDDFNDSIEVGRNAQTGSINPDVSLLDINDTSKEINLGIDAPLETIDDNDPNDPNSPAQVDEPLTPPSTGDHLVNRQPRKKLVGITEEGTLKTNKRRLQIDSDTDLEEGITIEELKRLQSLQLEENWRQNSYTFKLSEREKLQLIQELTEPAGFKKRKLWDLNTELSQICQKISTQEQRSEANNDNDTFNDYNFDQDQSHAFDDLNFDLSLPDLAEEDPENINNNYEHEHYYDNDDDNGNNDPLNSSQDSDIATSTKTVAEIIKHENNNAIDFQTIISKDTSTSDSLPLGTNRRGNQNMLNMKKEASKCFFELLVLASRDCITIDQTPGDSMTDIGKDINVTAKDRLFSSFV